MFELSVPVLELFSVLVFMLEPSQVRIHTFCASALSFPFPAGSSISTESPFPTILMLICGFALKPRTDILLAMSKASAIGIAIEVVSAVVAESSAILSPSSVIVFVFVSSNSNGDRQFLVKKYD